MAEKWSDEKIIKAIGRQSKIETIVFEKLSAQTGQTSMLVLAKPDQYGAVRNAALGFHLKNNAGIVIVSLNGNLKKLSAQVTGLGDSKNVFFIDMFSEKPESTGPNSVFIAPNELSDCSDFIEKILGNLKGKSPVIVLDSLSTLLVYNDEATVKRFVHSLIGKASAYNASALILGLQDTENEGLAKTISQFVDTTVVI